MLLIVLFNCVVVNTLIQRNPNFKITRQVQDVHQCLDQIQTSCVVTFSNTLGSGQPKIVVLGIQKIQLRSITEDEFYFSAKVQSINITKFKIRLQKYKFLLFSIFKFSFISIKENAYGIEAGIIQLSSSDLPSFTTSQHVFTKTVQTGIQNPTNSIVSITAIKCLQFPKVLISEILGNKSARFEIKSKVNLSKLSLQYVIIDKVMYQSETGWNLCIQNFNEEVDKKTQATYSIDCKVTDQNQSSRTFFSLRGIQSEPTKKLFNAQKLSFSGNIIQMVVQFENISRIALDHVLLNIEVCQTNQVLQVDGSCGTSCTVPNSFWNTNNICKCSQNYKLVNLQCIKCGNNCLECIVQTQCLKCQLSYFISNGLCQLCSQLCSVCTSTAQCTQCKTGSQKDTALDICYNNNTATCGINNYIIVNKCYDDCPYMKNGSRCISCFLTPEEVQCELRVSLQMQVNSKQIKLILNQSVNFSIQDTNGYTFKDSAIIPKDSTFEIHDFIQLPQYDSLNRKIVYYNASTNSKIQNTQLELQWKGQYSNQPSFNWLMSLFYILLFLLVPTLQVTTVMIFLAVTYPHNAWLFLKIIASFTYVIGSWNQRSSTWYLLNIKEGNNLAGDYIDRAAFSNIFIYDSYSLIFIYLILFISYITAFIINKLIFYPSNQTVQKIYHIFIKSIYSFILIFIGAFYQQIKQAINSFQSSTVVILSLIIMLAYFCTIIIYLFYKWRQILQYKQDDDEEKEILNKNKFFVGFIRYEPIESTRFTYFLINLVKNFWNSQTTKFLDFLYLITLGFFVFGLATFGIAQIICITVLQLVMLGRFLIKYPYCRMILNGYRIGMQLSLLLFLCLVIFTQIFYQTQVIKGDYRTELFEILGILQIFLLTLYNIAGITSQIHKCFLILKNKTIDIEIDRNRILQKQSIQMPILQESISNKNKEGLVLLQKSSINEKDQQIVVVSYFIEKTQMTNQIKQSNKRVIHLKNNSKSVKSLSKSFNPTQYEQISTLFDQINRRQKQKLIIYSFLKIDLAVQLGTQFEMKRQKLKQIIEVQDENKVKRNQSQLQGINTLNFIPFNIKINN